MHDCNLTQLKTKRGQPGRLVATFAGTPAFLLTTLVTSLLAGGCLTKVDRKSQLQRFEFSQAQMGLDFRITVFAPD